MVLHTCGPIQVYCIIRANVWKKLTLELIMTSKWVHLCFVMHVHLEYVVPNKLLISKTNYSTCLLIMSVFFYFHFIYHFMWCFWIWLWSYKIEYTYYFLGINIKIFVLNYHSIYEEHFPFGNFIYKLFLNRISRECKKKTNHYFNNNDIYYSRFRPYSTFTIFHFCWRCVREPLINDHF